MPLFESHPGDTNVANYAGQEFDFIICGGGTAGCVLASRLTEDPSVSVLVIEAGESDQKQLMSRIPAGWPNLWRTDAEWGFDTVPQTSMKDSRELFYPRGKMLGGCSSINAQIYQRCAPQDYDDWEAKGAKGWNWKSMKPYFEKAEHFTPNPDHAIDVTQRGKTGHWKTSYPPTTPIAKSIIESTIAAGVPFSNDLNVERQGQGVSRFQAHVDGQGARSSTAAAYLAPSVIADRKNLSILTATMVTRLQLDASSNRVLGVEVGQTRDGERWKIQATKEVLVCQGAIGSPHLLLASGLGRKADLDTVGVKVVRELSGVGYDMKDHPLTPIAWNCQPGTSLEYIKDPIKVAPAVAQWMLNGKGDLSNNLAEVGIFLRSDNVPGVDSPIKSEEVTASGPDAPDLEIVTCPAYYVEHSIAVPPMPGDQVTLAAIVLRPVSSGTVKIKSENTFESPLIDPAFFSDPKGHDLKVQLQGMKLILKIAEQEPLKSQLIKMSSPLGGDKDLSDEELTEQILATSETVYHPTSSCKMGPEEDGGVLDSDLKVYGFSNLRVIDASSWPSIVSGHPCAAVVATAERAADIIKGVPLLV